MGGEMVVLTRYLQLGRQKHTYWMKIHRLRHQPVDQGSEDGCDICEREGIRQGNQGSTVRV
jgi:hypothetical protein